jgi:hypothetical protein
LWLPLSIGHSALIKFELLGKNPPKKDHPEQKKSVGMIGYFHERTVIINPKI